MIGSLLQHIRATLAFSILPFKDAGVIGSPLSPLLSPRFYPCFSSSSLFACSPPLSSSLHLPGMVGKGKHGGGYRQKQLK
mmetsp:Transcript_40144/g.104065  ORF Transcript_40144/g.104065 Transcript_40144/m.104065 type:complete len:80 (+) Transcript_40144:95-334(+)